MEKTKNQNLKESNPLFFETYSENKISCLLCPINCKLSDGQNGKCHVRKNINNKLFLTNYGISIQCNLDRLENRPIYLLGKNKKSLSIGLTGCNNTCPFCQNWEVSQNETFSFSNFLSPEDVIRHALSNNAEFISFTYTEPIVWIEYLIDVAELAKKNNIKICLKTAGYIEEKFYNILLNYIDCVNLDIKPLEENYLKKCGIYNQKIVWNFAKKIVEKNIHLEISHILISGINDNEKYMNLFSENIKLIKNDMGIHLLRHYPAWKSNYKTTPIETMTFWKNYLKSKGHTNVFANEVG